MNYLTTDMFADALRHVCNLVIANEPKLTELDNIVGDGDHGDGMRDGFTELKAVLGSDITFSNLHELTRTTGMALVKSMGGASGVIFGTLFIGGHDAVVAEDGSFLTQLDTNGLRRFFRASADAISRRGRAKANDRTMLDALLHACDAMEACRTDDVSELLKAGWEGACQGAEATKQMLPRLGRSKNFRTHVLGYPDPGAVSTSIIFQGLYEAVSQEFAK